MFGVFFPFDCFKTFLLAFCVGLPCSVCTLKAKVQQATKMSNLFCNIAAK